MIVDDFGNLVWFNAIGNRELATDFRVQTYLGKPVLTWWQGRLIGGEGRGEGVIYDTAYRPVRRVRAGNGLIADLHEFELTPQGTALLLIYDAVQRDLRGVGGARKGVVVQAVVQEVDIATGLVLFEWHSLGNVGLSESHETVPEARRPVGLRARQLGRARRRRRLHRLRAPDQRGATGSRARAAGSCGAWAARGRTSSWGRARASASSTTRARSPTGR